MPVSMIGHVAFIGLGSNLEHPHRQLQQAFVDLEGLPDTRLLARSSAISQCAAGLPNDRSRPDFVNAVAKIATDLAPQALLMRCCASSTSMAASAPFATRRARWIWMCCCMTMLQLHGHGLTIPHPQMHKRAFVLATLAGDRAGYRIPGYRDGGRSMENVSDQHWKGWSMLSDKYRYVVVEGPIGVGKTSLVQRLARHVGATTLLEKPDKIPFSPSFTRTPSAMRWRHNCSSCSSAATKCAIGADGYVSREHRGGLSVRQRPAVCTPQSE